MANSPLIVTWPGGIGNPIGEKIPTSGGRRRKAKASRRSKKSKVTRKHRTRKTRRTVRR